MICLAQGEKNILDKRIELFEPAITFLNRESTNISTAASELARKYKVPLSFERIPLTLEEAEQEDVVIIPLSSLRIKNITVREFLDTLIKADNRYCWQEKDGFINIIPVTLKDDPAYIMNRKLKSFRVENKSRGGILEDLNKQLGIKGKPEELCRRIVIFRSGDLESSLNDSPHPEQFIEGLSDEVIASYGGRKALESKVKFHSLNLKNVTVREVLNALAKENNAYWSYTGVIGCRILSLSSFSSP